MHDILKGYVKQKTRRVVGLVNLMNNDMYKILIIGTKKYLANKFSLKPSSNQQVISYSQCTNLCLSKTFQEASRMFLLAKHTFEISDAFFPSDAFNRITMKKLLPHMELHALIHSRFQISQKLMKTSEQWSNLKQDIRHVLMLTKPNSSTANEKLEVSHKCY